MEVPGAGGGMVRSWELQTEGKSVLKSVFIKRYFGTSSPSAPGTDQKPRQKHRTHLPQKGKQGNLNHCSKKIFSSFLLHRSHVSSAEPWAHLASCPTLLPPFPEDNNNVLGLQKVEKEKSL